jgi:hypothetical protein
MAGPLPKTLFRHLALSVAAGETVSTWGQEHGVERATGEDWHRSDAFKRLVDE